MIRLPSIKYRPGENPCPTTPEACPSGSISSAVQSGICYVKDQDITVRTYYQPQFGEPCPSQTIKGVPVFQITPGQDPKYFPPSTVIQASVNPYSCQNFDYDFMILINASDPSTQISVEIITSRNFGGYNGIQNPSLKFIFDNINYTQSSFQCNACFSNNCGDCTGCSYSGGLSNPPPDWPNSIYLFTPGLTNVDPIGLINFNTVSETPLGSCSEVFPSTSNLQGLGGPLSEGLSSSLFPTLTSTQCSLYSQFWKLNLSYIASSSKEAGQAPANTDVVISNIVGSNATLPPVCYSFITATSFQIQNGLPCSGNTDLSFFILSSEDLFWSSDIIADIQIPNQPLSSGRKGLFVITGFAPISKFK